MNIKVIPKVFAVCMMLLILTSCASWIREKLKKSGEIRTSYNVNFKREIDDGKRIMISRFQIFYHDIDVTEKCEIRLNENNLLAASLGKDGYFFISSHVKKISIIDIGCMNTSSTPDFYYTFKNISILLDQKLTYVGDIILHLKDKHYSSWWMSPRVILDKYLFDESEKTKEYFEGKFSLKIQSDSIIKYGGKK